MTIRFIGADGVQHTLATQSGPVGVYVATPADFARAYLALTPEQLSACVAAWGELDEFGPMGACARHNVKLLGELERLKEERTRLGQSMAAIEGDQVVIRVPIAALPVAMSGSPIWHDCHVTDAAVFAVEFVRALNEEEEDGTTLLHRAFDKAMSNAVESGCDGVAEGQGTLP